MGVEFRILGPLEADRDGRPIALGGRKQRTVLGLLLLHANGVVSTDRLVDELWGAQASEGAVKTLRSYLSRLRGLLDGPGAGDGGCLRRRPPGYLLAVEPDQVDARRFERLAREGREALSRGEASLASVTLAAALDLWHGPVLADLAGERFAYPEAGRLEELRLAALEDRIEADLTLGRHGELVGEIEALLAAEPLRERLWGQLMRALYGCDRQAEALAAYRRARHVLVEELGLEPGPALQELERAVLLHDMPAPLAADRRSHNLPVQLTSFVGRERAVEELTDLLGMTRLLTLSGAGGTGKTRLALEVAGRALPKVADGVWLVELAPLADAAFVPSAVAGAVGVEERGERAAEALVDHLRARATLLVLDNCEHLVSACARLVDRLLRACPGLLVLATSREPLGVVGEVVWTVPPLDVPEVGPTSPGAVSATESERLFVERARAVRVGFAVTAEEAPALGEICRRLDGAPLALELAAARVAVLGVAQIAARLDDQLALLAGGRRMAPRRQQTIEATLQWSYDLLPPAEQSLLRRVSVFRGGFSLEAVEAIGAGADGGPGEVLELLGQLVAKSLVVSDTTGMEARYRLLEPVRQYAARRLGLAGEADAARTAHGAYFLALSERAEPGLTGGDQGRWAAILDLEVDNLRAALEWAVHGGRAEAALRLSAALSLFWHIRGHLAEGRAWLIGALSAGEPESPEDVASTSSAALLRSRAHWGLGFLLLYLGDLGGAQRAVEQSLESGRRAGDPQAIGRSLSLLADLETWRDPLAALPLLTDAVAEARAAGDGWCLADSLRKQGWANLYLGDTRAARPRFEETLALARERADARNLRGAYGGLGWTALLEGDHPAAETLLGECLRLARELGDAVWIAQTLNALGELARATGRHRESRTLLEEALARGRELDAAYPISLSSGLLGRLALDEGSLAAAERWFSEALEVAERMGLRSFLPWWHQGLGDVARRRGERAAATGSYERALDLARAVGHRRDEARSRFLLGRLAAEEGSARQAEMLFREALAAQIDNADGDGVLDSLEALARLQAPWRPAASARAMAAADGRRRVTGARRGRGDDALHAAVLLELEATLGREAFAAAVAAGGALAPDEAAATWCTGRAAGAAV